MEKTLVHSISFPIRWGDMDAYGHVNNTMYFLYVQEARFAMLTERNIPIGPKGSAPVLAATTCKFIRPINFPETLLINTYLTDIQGKKAFFEHDIQSATKPDMTYANIGATIVWFDFNNQVSIDIPQYIYDLSSNPGLC